MWNPTTSFIFFFLQTLDLTLHDVAWKYLRNTHNIHLVNFPPHIIGKLSLLKFTDMFTNRINERVNWGFGLDGHGIVIYYMAHGRSRDVSSTFSIPCSPEDHKVFSLRLYRNESTLPGDVVHHESAGGSSVVAASDCAESLLARRVPDLQLHLLPAHLDYPCAELHPDRVRAVRHDWFRQRRRQQRLRLSTWHCRLLPQRKLLLKVIIVY